MQNVRLIYFTLFFFLILASLVKAEISEIDISKEEYKAGETFQAEINFNINLTEDISANNFELFQEENKISVGFFFLKLTNYKYFVYFNLPKNLEQGNYTFKIKNVIYIKNNVLRSETQTKDFKIISREDPVLAFNPGVIKYDQENIFNIEITNNGEQDIDIYIQPTEFLQFSKQGIFLRKNTVETFQVLIEEISENTNILINALNETYKIPIYVETKKITEIPEDAIKFIEEKDWINLTLFQDKSAEGPLKFKNFFAQPLYDLTFSLTGNLEDIVEVEINSIDVINPGEVKEQYLMINKDKDAEPGLYSGNLTLTNDNVYSRFPITVKILEKEENLTVEENETITLFGKNKTEETNYTYPPAIQEEEKSKTWLWVSLLIILVIIIIAIIIFYKRHGMVKQEFDEYVSEIEKKK